jgi:alpha-1,2-mannosyltransferase
MQVFPVPTMPSRSEPDQLAERLIVSLLVVMFVAISGLVFRESISADFHALWIAGQWLADGRPDLVYPTDPTFFTMLPPPEWIDRLEAEGFSGQVYPFIYPPIWAWLAAEATHVMRYETLLTAVAFLNPLMIVAMLLAARRLAAPTMRVGYYLGLGLVLLLISRVGLIALIQNQPQVTVAFLTVLAIERAEYGSPRLGGVLLALAAAIKLYPAIYALFWLASGQKRAAASFALVGGAIGLLSVAVAGWPLHLAFLHMIRVISDTAMVTPVNYALESTLAHSFYLDQLTMVLTPRIDPSAARGAAWTVLAKPVPLAIAMKLMQVGVVLWLMVLFRKARDRQDRAALWPFAFGLFTLVGPIAWCYHYLSSVAFAPMLVQRLRPWPSALLLLVFAVVTSPFTLSLFDIAKVTQMISLGLQTTGTLAIVLLLVAFYAVRHVRPPLTARDAP